MVISQFPGTEAIGVLVGGKDPVEEGQTKYHSSEHYHRQSVFRNKIFFSTPGHDLAYTAGVFAHREKLKLRAIYFEEFDRQLKLFFSSHLHSGKERECT